MKRDRRRCWSGALLGLMWSVGALAQPGAESPVLTLDRYHPLVPNSTGEPMVQVYASGLVKIARPAGFRDPGVYEVQLSQDQVQNLIRLIGDAQRAPAALNALQFDDPNGGDPNRELVIVSDATVSTVSFAPVLQNDGAGGGATILADRLQSVQMQELSDVPDNAAPGLESLRGIEQSMLNLFARAGDAK